MGSAVRKAGGEVSGRYAALLSMVRGGLAGAVVAFGLTGVMLMARWVVDDRTLPTTEVALAGELDRLDSIAVRGLLQPYVGRNFLRLPVAEIRAAMEAHPWVERAIVTRTWPDTMRVLIRQRTPVAAWGEDHLIDQRGVRFEARAPAGVRLPRLHGPQGSELLVMQRWQRVRDSLSAVSLMPHGLTHDPRGAWHVSLDDGFTLELGREQFDQRLQRFVQIYPRALSAQVNRIEAVDLRYTNGLAVRWRSDAASVNG